MLVVQGLLGPVPRQGQLPAFRSKFLELYYSRYLRPLKQPAVTPPPQADAPAPHLRHYGFSRRQRLGRAEIGYRILVKSYLSLCGLGLNYSG